jgi:hypothetical protein
MFISHDPEASHTIAAIEGQIVLRLAQLSGRDPEELARELRMADRDLPIESSDARCILGQLEQDFGVLLPCDRALEPRLNYARELAKVIQRRIARGHTCAGTSEGLSGGARRGVPARERLLTG